MKTVVICVLLVALIGCRRDEQLPPTQKLSKLTAMKVDATVIVEYEGGGVRALYETKGDALVGIDLDRATTKMDRAKKTVEIKNLPHSSVISPNARFLRPVTEVEKSFWSTDDNVVRAKNEIARLGQQQIAAMASTPQMVQRADSIGVRVLESFYKGMGYHQVVVEWKEDK